MVNDFRLEHEEFPGILADIADRYRLRCEHLVTRDTIGPVGPVASECHMIHPLDAVLIGEVPRCHPAMPHLERLPLRVERRQVQ